VKQAFYDVVLAAILAVIVVLFWWALDSSGLTETAKRGWTVAAAVAAAFVWIAMVGEE
jgi:uncharacterized membrane protein YwzB